MSSCKLEQFHRSSSLLQEDTSMVNCPSPLLTVTGSYDEIEALPVRLPRIELEKMLSVAKNWPKKLHFLR